ncbi:MAG TPA: hypothetical protein VEQ58_21925, partial [Polyangiaceae bacterium]|nr:hypothetical protein [Polyangiaceae bacterium]
MGQLKLWVPVVLLGTWGLVVGCDDDRAVTDLGTAGDNALGGGGAETGGGGAGGEPVVGHGGYADLTPAGTGGGGVGGEGANGGVGGGEGGAGGAEPFVCPLTIGDLDATACP